MIDLRRRATLGVVAAGALGVFGWRSRSPAVAEDGRGVPPAADDVPGCGRVVVAGGCFWGVQGVFQHVHGVTRAVSGYAGGVADTAHYETVSTGRTGHAEAVEVSYDPALVSFGQILQVFFAVAHDPTQLDGQGPDRGTQYRSAIFTADAEQERVARAYIAQLGAAGVFSRPIVTRLEAGREFFAAEAYHQDYMTRHPGNLYIAMNDQPKLDALQRLLPQLYRSEPVLIAAS